MFSIDPSNDLMMEIAFATFTNDGAKALLWRVSQRVTFELSLSHSKTDILFHHHIPDCINTYFTTLRTDMKEKLQLRIKVSMMHQNISKHM